MEGLEESVRICNRFAVLERLTNAAFQGLEMWVLTTVHFDFVLILDSLS
jgi:hypothetical protein